MKRGSPDDQDRSRVEAVFDQHGRFIEAVAFRHASNPQDVPDIVQTVAVTVCQKLNGFRGDSELQTWLFRVTVNAARSFYRTESRFQAVRGRLADHVQTQVHPVEDPDQVVVEHRRLAALQDAVARLRPQHQAVVRHELSGSGVQCSNAARYRARKRLRDLLAGDIRLQD